MDYDKWTGRCGWRVGEEECVLAHEEYAVEEPQRPAGEQAPPVRR